VSVWRQCMSSVPRNSSCLKTSVLLQIRWSQMRMAWQEILQHQLKEKCNSFLTHSVAIDVSTDIARLAFFIQNVNEDFQSVEEILELVLIKEIPVLMKFVSQIVNVVKEFELQENKPTKLTVLLCLLFWIWHVSFHSAVIRDYSVCHKDYKTNACSLLKLKYKISMVYKILNTYHDYNVNHLLIELTNDTVDCVF